MMKYHGMRGRYLLVLFNESRISISVLRYYFERAQLSLWKYTCRMVGSCGRERQCGALHLACRSRPDKNMFNTTAAHRETQTCGQFTSDITSELGADQHIEPAAD
jgi:hypothetical protein